MTQVSSPRGKGFNPLRWKCDIDGCFNKMKRPKIEVFYDCFPGRINFGDVDGIVEIAGRALILEWKEHGIELPTGQRIMYKRLSSHIVNESSLITVAIVHGQPTTMEVYGYSFFSRGLQEDYVHGTLEDLKDRFCRWAKFAEIQPANIND